jgi:hypothetical protein
MPGLKSGVLALAYMLLAAGAFGQIFLLLQFSILSSIYLPLELSRLVLRLTTIRPIMEGIDPVENEARMLRGELYYAFLPDLTAKRNR